MLVYAYCLLRSKTAPSFGEVVAAVPGGSPPRALPAQGDRWLVVSDVPEDDYSAELVERQSADLDWLAARAVGHQDVVEASARAYATVPLRLFTLFRDERSAIDSMAKISAEIDETLDRITGKDEWAVRVLYAGPPESAPQPTPSSGTAFLLRKQHSRQSARRALEAAYVGADNLFADLCRIAADQRRRPPIAGGKDSRPMLLDAAFLVERTRVGGFRDVVERFVARHPESEAAVTGPWPAYSFAARPLVAER